ncbi:stage V sporulation protein E [Paenactinomyces guangxiensis]|uniref:Stage V sporulation protein E n=1 Tax=Paenactinomyces guangxiensis TaxID=1490290 RepID=A0A7W1WQJ5_9BACL|nr:stage V sporulation protein E [Paenactinomyces guangxiensis]MBA4494247.1 stage V sporulation protein E [Paenactinomyces guangxiensis]MBH8590743.1 stage V sporulation protein E [Paenactinomyces guangxiensis]
MNKMRTAPDFVIVAAIFLLLAIGVVMVYSASAAFAYHKYGDSFYFAKRQLLFAALGVFLMFLIANIDRKKFEQWAAPGLILCFVLLAVVLIPGVGILRNGARSWLGIGAFSIQPSEFMKLAMIAFLAKIFSRPGFQITRFTKGFLPGLAILGAAFALIMLQPDLGTGTVLVGTGLILIFAAGARMKHIAGFLMLGAAGFIGLVLAAPYRIQRIVAFLNPWQDPRGAGYHLIQSLYAIGPGGLLGLGLGMSRQKHLYLPEPHTDFIFSIFAEELGFLGAGTVVILFAVVVWRGLRIAISAPDLFSSLVATGITAMIMIQAVINIGVVSGAFPVTGITLPFLSYGGSSLTLTLAAVGILLNLSRYTRR